MTGFLSIAIAATLLAVSLVVVPLYRATQGRATLAALLTALSFPLLVAVIYAYVTNYPWFAPPATGSATAQQPVAPVDTPEINALRSQLTGTAQDADILGRLGEAYLAAERFADAREAFRQVLQFNNGGNDEMRLAFAEAAILADRNALLDEAGAIIDEVLRRAPENPKALWYGAMVALTRGDTQTAQQRWRRLLQLDPPPQVRQILEEQLARLDAGGPAVTAEPSAGEGTAVRIPVRISVRPELAARIQPGASLFLIARAAGGAGPPLAVVRRPASGLPLDLEISDADSMVPGRSMAGVGEIRLTARIANDGEALAAPGDVFGEVLWRPGSATEQPLPILMDRVVD
jgi:cytochrome c-type biogenesis protein CcmH